jgi:hypothetical protein
VPVKGLGELGNVGAKAAAANAVYQATGKRLRALPIRIEDFITSGTLSKDMCSSRDGALPHMLRAASPVDTSTSHAGFRCVVRERTAS